MVKFGFALLLFVCLLHSNSYDDKLVLAKDSINAISKTQNLNLNNKLLLSVYDENGLSVSKIIALLGREADFDFLNSPVLFCKFVAKDYKSAILFLKALNLALDSYSDEIGLNYISRLPLEYGASIKKPDGVGMIAMQESLLNHGLKILGLQRDNNELVVMLDASDAKLNAPIISQNQTLFLRDSLEIEIAPEVMALEIKSRIQSAWVATLRFYDENLNAVARIKIDPKTQIIDVPYLAKYVLISDEIGIAHSSLMLIASQTKQEEE